MTGTKLVLTYVALVALAATSFVVGSDAALPVAIVKAGLIAMVFMELASAHPVPRIVAVVGVLFVLLLAAGTLADVAFR
jgi:caa(3)-type oxidase subunit IV